MDKIPHAFEGAFVLGCLALAGFSAFMVFMVRGFLEVYQKASEFIHGNEGLKTVWDLLN